MSNLAEQLETAITDIIANEARLNNWVNGDETTDYNTTGGQTVPSIRKFLNETFKWQGSYVAGGTDYVKGQTFEEGNAVYLVTANFTSTDFASDATNYGLMFSFNTFVTACQDAQTAAEAAQNLAEAALDEFTDQYLGAKSSAPATDNDGDPLTDGDVYYNTVDKKAYVWDTDEWVDFKKATAWGELTGTLADQTDLQQALNGKSPTSHTHTESDITNLDKYTQAEVDALLAEAGSVFALTNTTTPEEFASSPAGSVWVVGASSGAFEPFEYFIEAPDWRTIVNLSSGIITIQTTESGTAESTTILPTQSKKVRYIVTTNDDLQATDASKVDVSLLTSTGDKIPFSYLPTGTGAQEVARGDHTHSVEDVTDLDDTLVAERGKLILLDVASTNLAANTVIVTGPAFVETTDGKTYKVPEGVTTGTGGDNSQFVTKIPEDQLPEVINATVIPRNGTAATIDAIVLDEGEIANISDKKQIRVGDGTTLGGIVYRPIGGLKASGLIQVDSIAGDVVETLYTLNVEAGNVYHFFISGTMEDGEETSSVFFALKAENLPGSPLVSEGYTGHALKLLRNEGPVQMSFLWGNLRFYDGIGSTQGLSMPDYLPNTGPVEFRTELTLPVTTSGEISFILSSTVGGGSTDLSFNTTIQHYTVPIA